MKRYEKPSIEVMAVEAESQLLADSGIEIHDGMGDGTTGQLSKRKKEIIDDDDNDEDEGGFGW